MVEENGSFNNVDTFGQFHKHFTFVLSQQKVMYVIFCTHIGNCDIDFCHRQVWNFEILNLFERNWNFAVIFQKYRKQNQKSTKYFAISQNTTCILKILHGGNIF
jgi:hypothetical protein